MDRLQNSKRKKSKNKKGFTLIELIVVVAIIAIIAAVAVPKITAMVDQAKEATAVENLRNLRLAAITAAAEDPMLGVPSGSPSGNAAKQRAAAAIAEVLGQPMELRNGSPAEPYIPGIEIPGAAYWYFQIAEVTHSGEKEYRLYIQAAATPLAEGKKIGAALGLGKPTFTDENPFNENIYWATTSGSTPDSKPTPTLRILLHIY